MDFSWITMSVSVVEEAKINKTLLRSIKLKPDFRLDSHKTNFPDFIRSLPSFHTSISTQWKQYKHQMRSSWSIKFHHKIDTIPPPGFITNELPLLLFTECCSFYLPIKFTGWASESTVATGWANFSVWCDDLFNSQDTKIRAISSRNNFLHTLDMEIVELILRI